MEKIEFIREELWENIDEAWEDIDPEIIEAFKLKRFGRKNLKKIADFIKKWNKKGISFGVKYKVGKPKKPRYEKSAEEKAVEYNVFLTFKSSNVKDYEKVVDELDRLKKQLPGTYGLVNRKALGKLKPKQEVDVGMFTLNLSGKNTKSLKKRIKRVRSKLKKAASFIRRIK